VPAVLLPQEELARRFCRTRQIKCGDAPFPDAWRGLPLPRWSASTVSSLAY